MIGRTVSHYRIVEKLGEGGMGVVYRAVDTRLDRPVAIKFLPPEAVADPERKGRFVREAKAASALNHPNIVTIYDIGSADGLDFIAMEQIDGEPLDRRIGSQGLPVEEALRYASETAEALAAAHAAGIVHRDVKPANVMVTSSGRIKVLDFGLAKLIEPRSEGAPLDSRFATATGVPPATAATKYTREGTVLGTLAYMSPEQVEGKPADARSDVFALGAVLYEMLAGRRPFRGDSTIGMMTAILRDTPSPLKSLRPDVPADVERIVRRCLEKNPDARYPAARELAQDLSAARKTRERPSAALTAVLRQPRYAIPTLLLLVAALGAAAWLAVRASRIRWARDQALPEISQLAEKQLYTKAYLLAGKARRYAPDAVDRLERDTWASVSVETTPPGAEVSMRDYSETDTDWVPLGRSTVRTRIALGYLRWRIAKPGYETIEAAAFGRPLSFRLDPTGSSPPGMVRVPGGPFQLRSLETVELPDYWLDRYEVTNEEFQRFVKAGGYRTQAFWKEPFVRDDRALSWEEAMAVFRDSTGRPGPSTWELETFPAGRARFPVGGVSWYEAAAYANFAGKSLPTIYHWSNAAGNGGGVDLFPDILQLSNFGGSGPAAVGSNRGIGPHGHYDIAGNVREWCANETDGRRFILGGSWNDPTYVFWDSDSQSPFDRSPMNGVRCAKLPARPDPTLTSSIETLARDYSKERPVSDELFRIYASFYSYDAGDLAARTESVDDSPPFWRREMVSYRAAYGGVRIPAFLFLPRNAAPPYQTVVYFPASHALRARSTEGEIELRFLDFVVRSGRAVLYPIYEGTYQRRSKEAGEGPSERRDLKIKWAKDVRRSVDYLRSRKDVDPNRIAFYGLSLGAIEGPVFLALEDRFRTGVLLAGGFRAKKAAPEIEPLNFAPRVKMPVLLLGGRQDFMHPYETAQIPMFRMLGTPAKDKRHFVFEGGHVPSRLTEVIREILDWLDRYLGPLTTRR
jgi:formylglycine-generating enzyme required for sulfatase activity/dienelactone hydrolase/predicted Ser/Thr protein kinase